MEREVIAQKSKKLLAPIACLVTGAGALLIGLGYLLLRFTGILWLRLGFGIGGIVIGALGLALGAVTLARHKRTPDVLIEREGDSLFVSGKEFNLKEITLARAAASNRDGGTVMIETAQGNVKCDFVADTARVCEILNALVCESKQEEEENING